MKKKDISKEDIAKILDGDLNQILNQIRKKRKKEDEGDNGGNDNPLAGL